MAGYFREGHWIVDRSWETDKQGDFRRQSSSFRNRIHGTPELDRYRLYVSYACPWAHRTILARSLLNLELAVPMTVVAPYMGDDGWAFRDPDGHPETEPELGATLLRELYKHSDPSYSGRVTTPVLWDCHNQTIVNNESRDILEMLATDFAPLGNQDIDLYPQELDPLIDEAIDAIYEPINNGVYRCGFAGSQRAYDRAASRLFEHLAEWDRRLANRRYLCGAQLTAADLCMFTTLIRFDPVYHTHFKCNWLRICDFPHLSGYLRDIYQTPSVAETCRFDQIKQHYYQSHPEVNPKGIVPIGPSLAHLDRPHGREHLAPSHEVPHA